jgi:archaellum component FlaC
MAQWINMPGKKKANGDKPATQHDLSLVAGQLTARLDQVEKNMATRQDVNRLDRRMDKFDQRMDKFDQRMDKFDQRMDKFDQRMDKFDQRMDSLENRVERVYDVVLSIDQQLNEFKTHPTRIKRLEKSVFHR